MAIKEKSQLPPLSHKQLPPFSPKDEKKAQKELARLQKKKKRGFEGKTLWDWLQLSAALAIPLVVILATMGFSFVQFYLAGQQHQQDQKLAQQQRATDQQNALEQQRATILQAYLNTIQDLLLYNNLRNSHAGDEVAILARARTLTALQGLDPDRKGRLVQFLWEAKLIGFVDVKLKLHDPIINLNGADLRFAHFSGAHLSGANLRFADLRDAHLILADLNFADLSGAHLGGADLSYANLSGADLNFADLSGAHLSYATLTQQQFDQVLSCKGATLPKGLTCNQTL